MRLLVAQELGGRVRVRVRVRARARARVACSLLRNSAADGMGARGGEAMEPRVVSELGRGARGAGEPSPDAGPGEG